MIKKEIFLYWNNRNKFTNYSKKLNQLFNISAEQIAKFPNIGKRSGCSDTRTKIIRDYLIVYKEFDQFISIITIWDARQDPLKLQKILE